MPFDPHAQLFDAEGRGSRAAIEAWEGELLALFRASAEAREARADGSWVEIVLELAFSDREALATEIDERDLRFVLTDSFPLKVMCFEKDAAELLGELTAFWRFLDRAFAVPTAPGCLAVLADPAPIVAALQDPALYGGGKRVLMGASAPPPKSATSNSPS